MHLILIPFFIFLHYIKDTSDYKLQINQSIKELENVEISIDTNKIEKKICSEDMIYVHGLMIDADSEYVEALQNSTCNKWINTSFPERCKSFDESSWNKIKIKLPRKEMQFCIDIYESPNLIDVKPTVNITWVAANKICNNLGKRLCTEEEWTFACEGEESLPYPYGYIRDESKCNIDKPWIPVDYSKFNTDNEFTEILRLWQGANSGSYGECISPFGVHDMTGNVDEYTVSIKKSGHPSILKGGYWSTVRARCRSSTRFHNQWHRFYQQGFRCCSNPN